MSSERQKAQARTRILEILGSCEETGCHNATLIGRLQTMRFPRRVYASAIQSLQASGQIVRVACGDSYRWHLADQPVIAS